MEREAVLVGIDVGTSKVCALIGEVSRDGRLTIMGHGTVPARERIHVQQGVEIGRTSDLFLSADLVSGKVGDVRVGGSTVRVAKGQLFLP